MHLGYRFAVHSQRIPKNRVHLQRTWEQNMAETMGMATGSRKKVRQKDNFHPFLLLHHMHLVVEDARERRCWRCACCFHPPMEGSLGSPVSLEHPWWEKGGYFQPPQGAPFSVLSAGLDRW